MTCGPIDWSNLAWQALGLKLVFDEFEPVISDSCLSSSLHCCFSSRRLECVYSSDKFSKRELLNAVLALVSERGAVFV